ncbi:MAG TPA: glutamyl-tRNA reductase [Urbifossiella sp.]|jgi:glutamyl-tRNA reductase
MNLRAIGCNVASAPVELREKLAFDKARLRSALAELTARYGVEAAILGTCNRVELYLARPEAGAPVHAPLVAEFLAEAHGIHPEAIQRHLYEHADTEAVRHLFRVASGLDSAVIGEDQIAGQVKEAFELSQKLQATGSLLNSLFPTALRVSKRVRTETGISLGQVSVASAAIAYLRPIFETFTDKTVLVIGAGEMAQLTLTHLKELQPAGILVTNRTAEKAISLAAECGGQAMPWERLDEALVRADIVLSTTGAPEPIVKRRQFNEKVLARRGRRKMVIFDMAVPRDFEPRIDDGDRVSLFNVDDLNRVRDQQLAERRTHVGPAETIVSAEVAKFVQDWNRRKDGPMIGQLTEEVDRLRDGVLAPLLEKLNGRLTDSDRAYIEGAFRLFQSRLLHGPIAALKESSGEAHGGSIREAIRKLFGLKG